MLFDRRFASEGSLGDFLHAAIAGNRPQNFLLRAGQKFGIRDKGIYPFTELTHHNTLPTLKEAFEIIGVPFAARPDDHLEFSHYPFPSSGCFNFACPLLTLTWDVWEVPQGGEKNLWLNFKFALPIFRLNSEKTEGRECVRKVVG